MRLPILGACGVTCPRLHAGAFREHARRWSVHRLQLTQIPSILGKARWVRPLPIGSQKFSSVCGWRAGFIVTKNDDEPIRVIGTFGDEGGCRARYHER